MTVLHRFTTGRAIEGINRDRARRKGGPRPGQWKDERRARHELEVVRDEDDPTPEEGRGEAIV